MNTEDDGGAEGAIWISVSTLGPRQIERSALRGEGGGGGEKSLSRDGERGRASFPAKFEPQCEGGSSSSGGGKCLDYLEASHGERSSSTLGFSRTSFEKKRREEAHIYSASFLDDVPSEFSEKIKCYTGVEEWKMCARRIQLT